MSDDHSADRMTRRAALGGLLATTAATRLRGVMAQAHAPDLWYRSLTEVAKDIASRRLSPLELTQVMLDRIQRLDPRLQSYLTVTAEVALSQARRAETEIHQRRYRGPLHGIPVAVKDLCFTRGIPTSGGSQIHRDFRPGYDATVVSRLTDAGAVLLGKLNMTEGAGYTHHPALPRPTNPWREDLWTGVSSSGSGVATAAGLCYASVGSDTAGSIRFPSACNGLTGLKPTWGRVSRHGIMPFAESFDTIGPMGRSAADIAAVLTTVAGWDPDDPTTLPSPVPNYLSALRAANPARGYRIGIDREFNNTGTNPQTIKLIEAAIATLRELGAEPKPISFPSPAALFEHVRDLLLAELAMSHAATYPAQKNQYGEWLREAIEQGLAAKARDLAHATVERDKFRGRLASVFRDVDAIVIPVMPQLTPTWSELTSMTDLDSLGRFTLPLSATGSPTITLPCGFSDDSRPVGFQLIGPHNSEAHLLRLAHAYQCATEWHLHHPVLAA
jgi:amidase